MRAGQGIIAALLICSVVLADGFVGLGPPRSRIGRDVMLYWPAPASGRRERIVEPGSYEFDFRCGGDGDETVKLHAEVTREPAPEEDRRYRECSPDQVRELAEQGRAARVRFQDAFREVRLDARDAPVPMDLPDGQSVPVCYSFTTEGGIVCLVPDGAADLALVRAAMAGDTLHVRGQVFSVEGPGACVVVDEVRFSAPERTKDEPPWTVRIRWDGRDVKLGPEPGDYSVEIPCGDRRASAHLLRVRLRESKVADLEVKGHKVVAELALSRREMSYGLQGRHGLGPDHGMLFFFYRPARPVFVMKSVSFPLSVAFIRADGVITHIGRMNPGDRRGVTSPVPVNYVLEMAQGWFQEHGVAPGDRVSMP